MKVDFLAIELISIYPVFAEWVNTKLGGRGTGEVMPLWSIPDLGITTKSVTIAVGGHMTIRKWISTTNPFTNATQNAFRHKSCWFLPWKTECRASRLGSTFLFYDEHREFEN